MTARFRILRELLNRAHTRTAPLPQPLGTEPTGDCAGPDCRACGVDHAPTLLRVDPEQAAAAVQAPGDETPVHPDAWEFRLSPDRSQFAIWEPGNEPWFVPEANMPGRWFSTGDMDRLAWTRFVPDLEDTKRRAANLAETADTLRGLARTQTERAGQAERERDAALCTLEALGTHAAGLHTDLERTETERDGAYRERATLLAWLAALHPAVIAPAPDTDEDGWQILYLWVGGKQASWHIHPDDAHLFIRVEQVQADDWRAQWDGHTTEQKYEHIREHTRALDAPEQPAETPCTCSLAPHVMTRPHADDCPALDRQQPSEAHAAIARVQKVVAERLAEVAEDEAHRGHPSAWSDAVTVTCQRIEDALRPQPEPQGIRDQPEADGA